ncbi:unnamed protein product [Caenorhabditis brenneri]
MAAWSCLPPEIKLHVIRKLDFMSRKSHRCVSYSDRELVDSTIFTLPRVRFGYKKGRCLIVIYTGIEKFLRWEFELDDGLISYHRSENSFGPGIFVKLIQKTLPLEFPDSFMLMVALTILKELVAHKSIQIKTMEWELSSDGLSKADIRTAEIIIDQFFGVHTFRVEELVFPECNDDSLNEVVRSSKNMTGFKLSRRLGIIISGECLVPKVAHDFMKKGNDGTTWNVTTLIMKETRPMQQSLLQQNFYRLNVHYEKDYSCRAKYRSTYQKYETENVKREVGDDDIVGYVSESKCGYTIQKTHATHERELVEEIDTTRNKIKKCGLGDLCKRCADPFEYWYTQNLIRRFHFEPFWNGIIDRAGETSRDEDLEMVMLKVKLEKYEKEKARIQKIVDAKRGKVGGAEGRQWSWGFDKKKCQGLGFGAKKDTVTKSLPNDSTVTQEAIVTEKHTATQVPTVTEKVKKPEAPEEDTVTHLPTVTEENVVTQDYPVSEDAKELAVTQVPTLTEEVKEPLIIQEFTVTQDTTVTVQSPSLLKYLLVLIVIPIALAIIFAFF